MAPIRAAVLTTAIITAIIISRGEEELLPCAGAVVILEA
jgi:hypothetical protein